MEVQRRWFCTCTGERLEMRYETVPDEDPGEVAEPVCPRCGATPSSDPRRTVRYEDRTAWPD